MPLEAHTEDAGIFEARMRTPVLENTWGSIGMMETETTIMGYIGIFG